MPEGDTHVFVPHLVGASRSGHSKKQRERKGGKPRSKRAVVVQLESRMLHAETATCCAVVFTRNKAAGRTN